MRPKMRKRDKDGKEEERKRKREREIEDTRYVIWIQSKRYNNVSLLLLHNTRYRDIQTCMLLDSWWYRFTVILRISLKKKVRENAQHVAVLNVILFSIIFSLRLHDFIMFFLFQYLLQNLFNKIIYRYVMLLAIATFTKALRSSQDSLCTRLVGSKEKYSEMREKYSFRCKCIYFQMSKCLLK